MLQTQEQFFNIAFSLIHLLQCFSGTQNLQEQFIHKIIRISLVRSLTIFEVKNQQTHLRLQTVNLHMWLGFLDKLQDEAERKKDFNTIQEEIISEEFLWNKIMEIYQFGSYNFTGLETQPPLIICSPSEPNKKFISRSKTYACQRNYISYPIIVHLKILQYQFRYLKFSPTYNKTIQPQLFNQLIKTLSYFSINRQLVSTTDSEQFINSLLTLFIQLVTFHPQIIDTNWNNLLHLIIFPLLLLTKKQYEQFQQDPEDFIRLNQDCCDKQTLGEIKTETARFLEKICDRNQNFMQYVIQFCILAIQAHVYKKTDQVKIENTTALLPLETAFILLAIQSYNLTNFQAQISIIKKSLLSQQCFSVINQIQASRIFLFLAYNYSQIFKNPLQGKLWITYAMNFPTKQSTKIAAYDFVTNIVDQYFQQQFLIDFSQKLISEIQIKPIWQILNKTFNNHLFKISQTTMVVIIQRILQRLSQQIQRYMSRQIKNTQNIVNGLQLMRKVLSNPKYCNNKPKVLQQIYKVVPLYKTFKKINLQDIILKIINEFMQRQQTHIDKIFKDMLPQLLQQFHTDQYRSTPFYWIFNQFIFKQSNSNNILSIKQILNQSLRYLMLNYKINKKKMQGNLPLAHTLLLMQHFLMIHGNIIIEEDEQQLIKIYQLCVEFLPKDINEPENLSMSAVIIGRVLIVMMVCRLIFQGKCKNGGKQMVNKQIDPEKLKVIVYLLKFYDEEGVFTGQNSEVIVRLLCKELFYQTDPVSVTQLIIIMTKILKPSPKQQQIYLPSKSKKSASKQKSLKIKLKTRQNYEMILKKVKTPFQNQTLSSYQQFINMLNKMKANNQLLYKSIISYLPEEVKDKLRELFMMENSGGMKERHGGRKILKVGGVKRKDNNGWDDITESVNKKRQMEFCSEDQPDHEFQDECIQNQQNQNQNSLTYEDSFQKKRNSKHKDEYNDRKNKIKDKKLMKKLKLNEPSQQSYYQI